MQEIIQQLNQKVAAAHDDDHDRDRLDELDRLAALPVPDEGVERLLADPELAPVWPSIFRLRRVYNLRLELEQARSTLDKLLAYPRGFRKVYPLILSYGGCPILNTAVEADDRGVTLHLESNKQIRSDYLLWANGRTGNTDGMGLEEIGLNVNHRGQIQVDNHYRTAQSHIFAVGDVVGNPGLASASYDQGRFAGAQIARGNSDWELITDFPTGIYTMPEISSVGRTERELTAAKVPYEVGRALFRSIARAQITGHTVGMLKILFHRETLEILGIHCFGETAAEIIHIGQAIMGRQGEANSLRYFAETTFNYPTMAEAYRVAALNGLNRLHHEA